MLAWSLCRGLCRNLCRRSKVLERKDDKVLLELDCGNILLSVRFRFDMTEIISKESNVYRIDYNDLAMDKFLFFRGFWKVTKEGDLGVVHLHVISKPKLRYFVWFIRKLIDYSVMNLFKDIQNRALEISKS